MLIVLQGPTGSGKTTLMRTISNLIGASSLGANTIVDMDDLDFISQASYIDSRIATLLDNIGIPTKSQYERIKKIAQDNVVIITTIEEWPYKGDFVFKLERIPPEQMLIGYPL